MKSKLDSNKLTHLNILINAFGYPERLSIVFIEVIEGGAMNYCSSFQPELLNQKGLCWLLVSPTTTQN